MQTQTQQKVQPWTRDGLNVFRKFRKATEDSLTINVVLSRSKNKEEIEYPSTEFGKIIHSQLFQYTNELKFIESFLLGNGKELKINYIEVGPGGEEKTFYLRTYEEFHRKVQESKGRVTFKMWPSHFATFEEWTLDLEKTVYPQVSKFREDLLSVAVENDFILQS